MGTFRIGLLLGYGLCRLIPFVMTTYLLWDDDRLCTAPRNRRAKKLKWLRIIMGIFVNAFVFLTLHYCQYDDFEIVGYVKNIWGLNFYHQDVEYFAVSVFVTYIVAILIGIIPFFRRGRLCQKTEIIILFCGGIACVSLFLGLYAKDFFQSKIKLYEIARNNMLTTEDKEIDYIELVNIGILPCQIEDLYLSDDKYELQKISLRGNVIEANGILLVQCTSTAESFGINRTGETIYLSDGNNKVLEKVTIGELATDMAYIKTDFKAEKWEVGMASPGEYNSLVLTKDVEKPILSHSSGFYSEGFDLEISVATEMTIYYTLDGSIPDQNSYIYEQPIKVYDKSSEPNSWRSIQNVVPDWKNYVPDEKPVDKAFIVRAVAIDKVGNKSDEVTATYYIDKEWYEDKKIISLIADPEDLFGDESGIYVTGKEYDEWYLGEQDGEKPSPNFMIKNVEKEAVIELFDNSKTVFQQNVGIRIQGNSARESRNKRFSVFAREEYSGSALFDTILFNRETQSHSLLIREGLEDLVCQKLMEGRDIPIMQGEKVCLFLNGEYWYDNRYIREKYSAQYFEDNYGISKDNLIVYKGGIVDKGVGTDQILHDELFEYVQGKDFSSIEEYEKIGKIIDIPNYIDFMVANIYCANMDVDDTKNVVMWRSREALDNQYADGKMRWALYDMDAIEWNDLEFYNVQEGAEIDSFAQKPKYAKCAYKDGVIFSALRQNEEFCKNFVLTFMDLMNSNFTVDNVKRVLEECEAESGALLEFFEKRPVYMKNYLAREFNLTGTVESVIIHNDDSCGEVTINTISPKMNNGSWSGEYFTDYPITVSAKPLEGYKFVGWSGDIASADMKIEVPVPEGGLDIVAEFQKIN